MALTEKDWEGFIWAGVILLITGTFNFFRNHPHKAYFFLGTRPYNPCYTFYSQV